MGAQGVVFQLSVGRLQSGDVCTARKTWNRFSGDAAGTRDAGDARNAFPTGVSGNAFATRISISTRTDGQARGWVVAATFGATFGATCRPACRTACGANCGCSALANDEADGRACQRWIFYAASQW